MRSGLPETAARRSGIEERGPPIYSPNVSRAIPTVCLEGQFSVRSPVAVACGAALVELPTWPGRLLERCW